jgi:hypothetical protein
MGMVVGNFPFDMMTGHSLLDVESALDIDQMKYVYEPFREGGCRLGHAERR